MGDFRVAFHFCFKESPGATPFIWKLVLFTCKWTKICQNLNTEVSFFFQVAPVLDPDYPKDKTITEKPNGTFSLMCKLTFGHPEPNVTWEKNGEKVPGGNDTTLLLRSTKAAAGRYRCVVQNKLGTNTSRNATVVTECKWLTLLIMTSFAESTVEAVLLHDIVDTLLLSCLPFCTNM